MGPDEIPVEPQHGAYDDDLPDTGTSALEPDYEAQEMDETEDLEPIPSGEEGPS